ncbi:MAG: iron-sulfur cluster assembly scaffold protein, partial [Candidatus Paceibacterota bacterium]
MSQNNKGIYSDEVMEHFQDPHNYGKMEDADGVGKVGNIRCGDVMWLYIKVEDDTIKDVKFEAYGCLAAIATSSVITDLVKGKTVKEAMKLDKEEVVDQLGGLPRIKVHCSVLAVDALSEAVYDYLKKNDREISDELEKRHEKNEKEKEQIEEQYEDWS